MQVKRVSSLTGEYSQIQMTNTSPINDDVTMTMVNRGKDNHGAVALFRDKYHQKCYCGYKHADYIP